MTALLFIDGNAITSSNSPIQKVFTHLKLLFFFPYLEKISQHGEKFDRIESKFYQAVLAYQYLVA